MAGDHESARVAMEPRGDGGLDVIDPVERRRYHLDLPSAASVEDATADAFRFPVGTAVEVETEWFELPTVVTTYVRDESWEMIGEFQQSAEATFSDGPFSLEFTSPIKLYAQVDGPLTVRSTKDCVRIELQGEQTIRIGARSRHECPAATVTTTETPRDLMASVSAFSSALKTTSPERTFPTLRGHPPELELGTECSIPEELEPADDALWIEIPPDLTYLYPVAPLAYYLGAPIRPGSMPRICGEGFEYRFDDDFQSDVERTLKRVFVLECATRTEGLYPVDLYEREQLEARTDLDFASLYDAPQSARLSAYLDVPYDVVSPYVPEWTTAACVSPDPESAEMLPYLVDDLAVIKIDSGKSVDPDRVQNGHLHGMVRGDASTADAEYVQAASVPDAVEVTWVGDGMPVDATKAVSAAYRNRIGRTPDDGNIEIAVVCNDPAMDTEHDAVDEAYGTREDLYFDVSAHRNLSKDELREVLSRDNDLLHYIGHIDREGFRCDDGFLDARELDAVGVDAFLLNACRSYKQGLALIEAGAIGGIVTLSKVVNIGAVRIGRTVARLLNFGFPLHAALDEARDESVVGVEYATVGDAGLKVTQSHHGMPALYDLSRSGDGYEITFTTFAPGDVGAMCYPIVEGNERHFLASGSTGAFELSESDLFELLSRDCSPIRYDGTINTPTELAEEIS